MRTEDLIEAIAGDATAPRPWLAGRLAAALIAGGAISYALLTLDLGVRPDIASALTTWRFTLKVAVAALSLAAAYWAAMRLARPETTTRDVAVALAAAPAVLALAVAYELMTLPAAEWSARAIGSNARICLASVPLLSLAPLAAMLAALRAGAPRIRHHRRRRSRPGRRRRGRHALRHALHRRLAAVRRRLVLARRGAGRPCRRAAGALAAALVNRRVGWARRAVTRRCRARTTRVPRRVTRFAPTNPPDGSYGFGSRLA